jgi:arylsulfatase
MKTEWTRPLRKAGTWAAVGGVLAAGTVMCAAPQKAQAQDRAEKPNVVLMLADNLGFGDLSCYNGGTRGGMRTPNIDRLASEGLRFTQFLVEPGCTPSRAGLMTGQYSIRNGMSLIIVPGATGGLDKKDSTLGKLFKEAGYNTAYVGKWHLGPMAVSQPQNQGFDQWLLGFKGTSDQVVYKENMRTVGAPAALQKALSPKILVADGPGDPKEVADYDPAYKLKIEGEITKKAVAYIGASAKEKEPFFLMVGFTRPHFPNDVSDDFKGKSGAGKYGDSVVELDHRTGQILEAIQRAGVEDNTIVVWISDNGATVTATAIDEVHQGDNGPFRGELGDAYEGSIRTAGMIKWPGKIKPRVSNEMFSIHDFLPTFARIIGVDLPKDRPFDGVDQSAFLLGRQEKSNRESLITFIGDRIAAVRWKQFRVYPMKVHMTRNNPEAGGYLGLVSETAGFPQIYNIEADPKERVDIGPTGGGWIMGPYMQTVMKYKATLEQYPNPPAANVTRF